MKSAACLFFMLPAVAAPTPVTFYGRIAPIIYSECSPCHRPEIFWNFILPVPITTTRWVKAMEVRPGNARVFHHANVILDRSRAALRHETVRGAGFPGMDLVFEEETFDPDGHFLSWKPGAD